MGNELTQLKILLEETIKKVEVLAAKHDHERFIEVVEQTADERDALLKELNLSEAERKANQAMIDEILRFDQQLNRMVNQYFDSFKREIILLKKKKDTNMKYTNPYSKMKSPDGAFLDKRK
ncbi:hypothetical protein FPQ10_10830 [Allobacillus sp. SKP2-8]|uniref:hypothetical protein n=1 Tax=unclassified Allobacillus TaxID=2628859 RepID=UPI0011830E6E|nr:hypothetical protein [Allobacillus sp. SKP2-8]TSJ63718.1 hypothetical protein FPQ10_10830 [Allobacillus sp. SKP2-8]